MDVDNPIEFCQLECQEHPDCKGFTIKKNDACNLKNDVKSNVTISKWKIRFFNHKVIKLKKNSFTARGNYISGPKFCPIDGNWSEYDLWLPCSPMCGNGTSRRFRFCTNPEPSYGGKFCEGLNYEEVDCFTDCSQGKLKLLL